MAKKPNRKLKYTLTRAEAEAKSDPLAYHYSQEDIGEPESERTTRVDRRTVLPKED